MLVFMKYSFYLCCVLRNKGLKIVFLKWYNCGYKKLSLWKRCSLRKED